VPVPFAGLDEGRERRDIQPMVAVAIELDRLTADQQEWHSLIPVIERLTQIRERLAQVMAGLVLGLVGPKEPDQRIPAVSTICFDDQIGQ
jgi:hypothetical protein